MYSFASLVGPSLAGILFQVRQMLPFLVDGISYAVSVVTLGLIRTDFQEERTAQPRRLRAEIMEGLAWLWRHPLIRYIAFLTGGLNFVMSGSALILIVLLQGQGASPAVIGFVFAVQGIGAIVGAYVAVRLRKRMRFGTAILSSLWAWTLLWPLYAIAPSPLWIGVIVLLEGLSGPLYDVVQFSYRMALIPDELQGRVNSVFRLLAFGFQPLGLALTGWLLQVLHPVPTILIYTAVFVFLAVLTTINPDVRAAEG
jgi:hypothetical protein